MSPSRTAATARRTIPQFDQLLALLRKPKHRRIILGAAGLRSRRPCAGCQRQKRTHLPAIVGTTNRGFASEHPAARATAADPDRSGRAPWQAQDRMAGYRPILPQELHIRPGSCVVRSRAVRRVPALRPRSRGRRDDEGPTNRALQITAESTAMLPPRGQSAGLPAAATVQ